MSCVLLYMDQWPNKYMKSLSLSLSLLFNNHNDSALAQFIRYSSADKIFLNPLFNFK